MTYDFVPKWLEGLVAGGELSAPEPFAAPMRPLAPLALPLRCLSGSELAALVGELFTEGSLSWEQLRSLLALPELSPHLRAALRNLPAAREFLATGS
jgi:hypothetical protein